MKKILAMALALLFVAALFTGCSKKVESPSEPNANAVASDTTEEVKERTSADNTDADSRSVKIGFAIKSTGSSFYQALATGVQNACKERGWECTVLNADMDITKEQENVETLIGQQVDALLLDAIDPLGAVALVKAAVAAGVPVIEVDAPIDASAEVVTTVYNNNTTTAFMVGKYIPQFFADDELISSVVLSGGKGNTGGTERRQGMVAGIIAERMGLSEEEAWSEAAKFDEDLIANGHAFHEGANLEIRGQAYCNWLASDGLDGMEDLLVANPDINCLLSENDDMALGAQKAITAAGKDNQIQVFCAADGSKEGYLQLRDNPQWRVIGENSPPKVGALAVEIAGQVVLEGKTANDFDAVVMTEANIVTSDTVNDFYDPNSPF